MARDKFQRLSGDYQRQTCYNWETHALKYFDFGLISFADARTVVQRMCYEFKLPIPSMNCRKRNGGAWAYPVQGVIAFTETNIKPLTPIHEFAHYANKINDGHGPQFIRNYVHLLAKFAPAFFTQHWNEDALWDSAISYGLVVARTVQIGVSANCERLQGIDVTDLFDDLKDL